MNSKLKSCTDFLNQLNAKDIQFFERDLLGHLIGTYDILTQWQTSEDLAIAGLYHAIYLTDFFKLNEPTPENREKIRSVIGAKSEKIAYCYCVMNRREFIQSNNDSRPGFKDNYAHTSIELSKDEDRELVELIWANAVEQLQRETHTNESRMESKPLFDASRHRVGMNALAAYKELFE